MAFFPAVNASDRAVTDTVFAVFFSFAAFGRVITRGVCAAAEVAANGIAFQLACRVTCQVAKAVTAGALAEGWTRFKAAGESTGTKDSYGGLEDVFGEGAVWVMDREGEGCIFVGNVVWAKEPARGHYELNGFEDGIKAECRFELSVRIFGTVVIG